ncbi:hypothetical protein LguiB_033479 [Lonicera macranthoides]
MLSAAGSPLPLKPNDHAAVRMTSATHDISLKGPKENARLSTEVFSYLSQLQKSLPSITGSGSTTKSTTAAGWAAF